MFWRSYESFSILCDVFCQKGSFPAKTAVRANALLLKIRNNVNMKTLRNIDSAIFESHLCYSYIVWAQNINAVRRWIILQKRALQIMNFKDQ